MKQYDVAVIGAGFTGLVAAFRLSQRDQQVTVFEKENFVGGLAAGFKRKNWDWHLEDFFHHFFTSDSSAKNLATELGLADQLFFVRPKTSVFLNNQIAQFDSPLT